MFEEKHHTTVKIFQETTEYETKRCKVGDVVRYAKFMLDGTEIWVDVKRTVDITLPKDKICISYCEKKDGSDSFWLIHEPYKSQYFKNKVNLDQLNEELDALLSDGGETETSPA